MGLGAALIALACGGCEHAGRPVDETQAAPAAAATATVSAAPTTATSPATPPIAEAKPAAPAPAPPSAAAVPADPNEIRRVTVEEANTLRESGRGVLVDVRDEASYQTAHIAGALHIPLAELAQRLGELPRDKSIVTYCS